MMTSKVVYLGELRTKATHVKSNATLTTDAPTDNHGLGRTFSPTDLLATSLASCMLTIMAIQTQKFNMELKGMHASVQKVMQTTPVRFKDQY